jgi:hypothetical protein
MIRVDIIVHTQTDGTLSLCNDLNGNETGFTSFNSTCPSYNSVGSVSVADHGLELHGRSIHSLDEAVPINNKQSPYEKKHLERVVAYKEDIWVGISDLRVNSGVNETLVPFLLVQWTLHRATRCRVDRVELYGSMTLSNI